jgi:hypothetical protein
MTGCVAQDSADLLRRLDAVVERLVPRVATLLGSVASAGAVTTARASNAVSLEVRVVFPDGIGRGALVARVFRYRTSVRVDVVLTHNRMIALADGRPGDRPCFLNDFSASVTLGPDAEFLPEAFVSGVRAGVEKAVRAVEEHNGRFPRPWGRIHVAAE